MLEERGGGKKGGLGGKRVGEGGTTRKGDNHGKKAKAERQVSVAVKSVIEQTPTGPMLSTSEKAFVERALTEGVNTGQFGSEMLGRPQVSQAIVDSLIALGITPDFLAARIKDGLLATDTKFFAHEGIVTDEREVNAWGPRHNYLTTVLQMLGGLNKETAPKVGPNFFIYKSNLRDDSIEVGPPKTTQVRRNMEAAKARNRSHV